MWKNPLHFISLQTQFIQIISGIPQEVVRQHFGDAHEQVGVDMTIAEYLVNIGSIAMDGLGEPNDGTTLSFQLGLYQMAYM